MRGLLSGHLIVKAKWPLGLKLPSLAYHECTKVAFWNEIHIEKCKLECVKGLFGHNYRLSVLFGQAGASNFYFTFLKLEVYVLSTTVSIRNYFVCSILQ